MSIDTINYLLAKYYDSLTSIQYLYQDEIEKPSNYPAGSIKPITRYKVEINLMKRLIEELEELKRNLEKFCI